MHIGLIAGNGRFPFLVLDAARAQGHDVTVIAAKEETFSELNDAARRHDSPIHWISLGQLGRCIDLLEQAGVTHAVMAGRSSTTRSSRAGLCPILTFLKVLRQLTSKKYRRPDRRGGERAQATGYRADRFDRFAEAAPRRCRRAHASGAVGGRTKGLRVRLPDGGRDRRPGYWPDSRGQASGGRCRGGDGRDR